VTPEQRRVIEPALQTTVDALMNAVFPIHGLAAPLTGNRVSACANNRIHRTP